ncbi:MAG TPA: IS630 family transposase [Vicinamibacteria bacterium]|nr:IS630 family transposase [Vicinamibacteria bacterium]
MWSQAARVVVSQEQRALLESWQRAASTPQSVALRCRIILLGAEGVSNNQISKQLEVSRPTILLWRQRFEDGGPHALTEIAPGRGRPPVIDAAKVKRIVEATIRTKPRAATHWSCRTLATAQGVSPATVQRIWDANGLKPHRTKTFKLSTDKQFVEKLRDVVGLYLNPPDKALVLCVDEKSQIQALDRTQPGLPLKKGRCGTMTHDYKRNGTTTLFAALNVLDGKVIGECLPRHRHQEFLKFLRRIDREFEGLDLHLIVDNYGTHKQPKVKRWLSKHPRFHLHFTPTSSSWLNLVERWFRELTTKRIRRGVFHSVPELVEAIDEYLEVHNQNPKPFVWTASVEKILEKVRRCKVLLETLH